MLKANTTFDDPQALLWTGGWDSTFRLLKLLLVEKRRVQPYYVYNESSRRSMAAERRAMDRIRELLAQKSPEAAARLLPTIEGTFRSIAPSAEIARNYEACLERAFIGGQYEWLARFCRERGVAGTELAIHRDDKARELLASMIGADRATLDPKFEGDPRYELFKYFRFPLFDMTKVEMRAEAAQDGFEDLMKETWFCHRPRNGRPCGICNPCIYTIEEGLGDRVPLAGRIRYKLRVIPRVRQWLAQHPALYMTARSTYRKVRGKPAITSSATQPR